MSNITVTHQFFGGIGLALMCNALAEQRTGCQGMRSVTGEIQSGQGGSTERRSGGATSMAYYDIIDRIARGEKP